MQLFKGIAGSRVWQRITHPHCRLEGHGPRGQLRAHRHRPQQDLRRRHRPPGLSPSRPHSVRGSLLPSSLVLIFPIPFFSTGRRSHLRTTHSFEQEVLYPFRPPSDAAAAQAYFDLVKSGKGNGYTKPAEDSEAKPYLEELAARLGMPHISFGCATNDGYFGSFGYGNALLSRFREHPTPAPWALGNHSLLRHVPSSDCFF